MDPVSCGQSPSPQDPSPSPALRPPLALSPSWPLRGCPSPQDGATTAPPSAGPPFPTRPTFPPGGRGPAPSVGSVRGARRGREEAGPAAPATGPALAG